MSSIRAVFEVDPDGTIHLPVPQELRQGKVEIVGTMTLATGSNPVASDDQIAKRRAALEELRKSGGLSTTVGDALEWQRDLRQDRSLPGRD